MTTTTAKINLVGDGARISNVWFRAKVAAVTAYIDFGDINATIDSNGASVEDCLFGDEQTTFYTTNYIRCYNLWYGTIHGNHFRGVGNGTSTITAIYSYYSVNVSCTGNTFLFMGRCIRWNSAAAPVGGFFNEGWLMVTMLPLQFTHFSMQTMSSLRISIITLSIFVSVQRSTATQAQRE